MPSEYQTRDDDNLTMDGDFETDRGTHIVNMEMGIHTDNYGNQSGIGNNLLEQISNLESLNGDVS